MMKNLLNDVFFGKNNKVSGVMALSIVALIALGCTCNKSFDLSNAQSDTNSSQPVSNTDTKTKETKETTKTKSTAKADASKGEIPSDDELQDMVKETLLEFNDAVQGNDFTNFHAKICEPWQEQATPESLRESFKVFIDKDIDIAPISSLDAQFSTEPEIGRELGYKTLKLKGQYPTRPNLTKFELNYIPEGKEWKLSKIIVDTTQTK
ncbi:MAG TPA: hypothetical protein VF556_17200 [Pyrinomonadaceae bacterium]|jgi:hypothetical protein